jgi:hypothetical protein
MKLRTLKSWFALTLLLVIALTLYGHVAIGSAHAQFSIPYAKDPAVDQNVNLQDIDGQNIAFVNIQADTGVRGLIAIIKRVLRYVEYVLGGIGVVYGIIAGYRLLVGGGKIEEVATQEKTTIQWLILGFVVIALSDVAVNQIFFRDQGTFLQSEAQAKEAARFGAEQIKAVVNYFVAFIGSIAILAIVNSGIRIIISPGNAETVTNQRRVILWASLGLILINLADRLVFVFYNEGGTQGINVQAGLVEIAGLANYLLGFLGIIAAASLIYAGILTIANFGNPEAVSKAKNVVRDVALGIIIAFSAYTIISAIVRINGL